MGQYPGWLYQGIVEGSLNWGVAKEYSYREFSEKYTLHDSNWVGLFFDVAYESTVVLAFVWDAVWLPDEVAESTPLAGESPFLFVKAEAVSQVSTSGYKDVGGVSRGIAGAEVVEVGGKQLLVISDHYGGGVEITFSGRLKFLAVDSEQNVLPI